MSLLSSLRYEMKSDFVLDDEDIDGPTIEDSSGFFVGCAGLICDIGAEAHPRYACSTLNLSVLQRAARGRRAGVHPLCAYSTS